MGGSRVQRERRRVNVHGFQGGAKAWAEIHQRVETRNVTASHADVLPQRRPRRGTAQPIGNQTVLVTRNKESNSERAGVVDGRASYGIKDERACAPPESMCTSTQPSESGSRSAISEMTPSELSSSAANNRTWPAESRWAMSIAGRPSVVISTGTACTARGIAKSNAKHMATNTAAGIFSKNCFIIAPRSR